MGLHAFCALSFTAGYALREYGAFNYIYNSQRLTVYIMSQVLIYICPPLLELSNYHVLGRIFYYVPYCAPLPPGKVLSTFGGLMAIVETLNSLGVAFASNPSSSPSTQSLGSHLTIAALSIQLGVLAIFTCLASLFQHRLAKIKIRPRAVSTPLVVMYISTALILVRCIYRLVEHLGATSVDISNMERLQALSPILRYEWYFYIFEATLMLCNSWLWNIWHPGRYLPKKHQIHLAQDGVTEVESSHGPDTRSLGAKIGSILTFGILFRRKEGQLVIESGDTYQMVDRRS